MRPENAHWMLQCWQIEKEAQTWLDSDSDEEGGEKKAEETKMEEAAAAAGGAESSEPQPGTSQESEMERSPMEMLRADEGEMEEIEGAVGGSDWFMQRAAITDTLLHLTLMALLLLYVFTMYVNVIYAPAAKLVW